MVDVYLDDVFIGSVEKPREFVKTIREERRLAKLPQHLNIIFDKVFNEVYIEMSKGRARRPLIIVENGIPRLTSEKLMKLNSGEITWKELLDLGIIEYVDAAEEENCMIALYESDLTKEHTHLEVSPITILGICSSLIPYSNFGGSSRLIRGSKIQKQAIGIYSSNYLYRMDTDTSILHYSQVPVVNTFMHNIYNYKSHPAGQNVVIAMISFQGYNMQDAIILNKGSVERGFGRSSYFRPYVSEELRYSGGLTDEIVIPDKEVKGYKSEKDYRLLEQDGIVYTGANVKEDDVVIGKTSPPRFLGELEEFSIAANVRRESSTSIKQGEGGRVDNIIITENEEGNRLVQIRIRDERIPEFGDKFASRHGQKGVIGAIIPEEDVPFTARGVKPDILFSPHSIPGRMTISHLIEILAGKTGSLKGEYIDGTTFDAVPEEELRKELSKLGFRDNGTETMYNAITGEQFEAKIYIGNIYYLKLKHMVANKLHARASGRIQLLTRQPIEGRAKGGGLRIGEMEKDCFVAHGASLLLKERFDSDKTILYVCENCGMFAVHEGFKNRKYCSRCGSSVEIYPIEISYAFKLLLDELKSMLINPKLELQNRY
ncbi:DNA-directed RNA polymerase subunit B [Candidatus Woesearchaeota archaeon]|nr:DNA-directed RNA polymerase subunit B [Candidatus Woesearchaeota archaeon]